MLTQPNSHSEVHFERIFAPFGTIQLAPFGTIQLYVAQITKGGLRLPSIVHTSAYDIRLIRQPRNLGCIGRFES